MHHDKPYSWRHWYQMSRKKNRDLRRIKNRTPQLASHGIWSYKWHVGAICHGCSNESTVMIDLFVFVSFLMFSVIYACDPQVCGVIVVYSNLMNLKEWPRTQLFPKQINNQLLQLTVSRPWHWRGAGQLTRRGEKNVDGKWATLVADICWDSIGHNTVVYKSSPEWWIMIVASCTFLWCCFTSCTLYYSAGKHHIFLLCQPLPGVPWILTWEFARPRPTGARWVVSVMGSMIWYWRKTTVNNRLKS